jgi:SAM-dependent methyltransferase
MKTTAKLIASLKIWVVIYPSITLFLYLFGKPLSVLPLYQRTLSLTIVLVPCIVFIGLPLVNYIIRLISFKNQSWDEQYKNRWDTRYKEQGHAYGKDPNLFFKEWLQKSEPGSILMPADGEGRNGVFAAQSGWKVTSFDLSTEGKSKALELAKENHVSIDYIVGDLEQLQFEKESFDAIGLVYAHFAADRKSSLHRKLSTWLKPGGIIILEAFSKNHLSLSNLDPKVGGPKDIDMLFSTAEISADFENYDISILEEKEILLDEGKYHIGKGAVIRFVGRKR